MSEAYNTDMRVYGTGFCFSIGKLSGILFPPICLYLYEINNSSFYILVTFMLMNFIGVIAMN